MREYPKRQTKKEYLRKYQKRYYEKLKARGYSVFTIVCPTSARLELKMFNQQLCRAWDLESKKQEEQKENADDQRNEK